ncbi:MAG TPA: YihY/virulence factor BrkB family protein [Micromonosporaceae bacterium]|nr:YihY/virulence factor BrkB family protein [Micromonosporaceae bacterium]
MGPPRRLRQLRWSTWRGIIWRSAKGFVDDNCGDWAAALTYYGVLAVFPSAIVVIALVRLFVDGEEAYQALMDIARQVLPASVVDAIDAPLHAVVNAEEPSRVLISFGMLGALWSASSYIGAFTRASNAIYGVREGRPFYWLRPLQFALAAVALVLMALVVVVLVVSGPVAEAVGDALGLGDSVIRTWEIGKWPLLVLLVTILLTLLYWVAPNVQQPRFRWLTVGGALALVVWVVGSVGFGVYVSNFGSYDKTYGSLGAVIAFLVWLYVSNSAIMLGVELNAEVQRGRQLQGGAEDVEAPLPPREAAQ